MNTARAEKIMRLVAAEATRRPDVRVSWVDLGQRIARTLVKDDVTDVETLAHQIFERAAAGPE